MGRRILRGVFVAVGTGIVLDKLLRHATPADLNGSVVLVTGASRGLGFVLAREFAKEGCRVAICARDGDELSRASALLAGQSGDVQPFICDVTDRAQVDSLIQAVVNHYGRIDILVNNAGIIEVGPYSNMTIADFEKAMAVMFWGILYITMAVLPAMKTHKMGRVVNVTSVGGKVSIPHLLPYSAAKFAAIGFSEGLHAELAQYGIQVTTIVPGLMRTGSFLNAHFKGYQDQEYTWFALGDNLPLISLDAEQAAREIIQATKLGEAERILSFPAKILARVHGLFPGATSKILGLMDHYILPSAEKPSRDRQRGMLVDKRAGFLRSLLGWGYSAAQHFNEYPGAFRR